MAHFRAVIKGQRGEASRLGSKTSGLKAVVNGWTVGCMVEARREGDKDVFRVYKTNGSNGTGHMLVTEIRG